jgi:hypothetical protein
MPSSFSRVDRLLHRRVYEAFEKYEDQSSIASIRDEAVSRHDKASTFVVAFSTILQRRNVSRSAPQWRKFNECLKEQTLAKEQKRWNTGLERLAFISMQWSPEVVSDYGWTAEKMIDHRDQTIMLYKCAEKYPCFEKDFLPRLNLVWWLQYTADIPDSMTMKGNSFRNKDLQHLLDLEKSGTITICGVKIQHDSTVSKFGQQIRTWTESKDGCVNVQGRMIDLHAARSKHWTMYALCTDKYGLLKRREHSQWTDTPLPAAVAQELHSYPFGDRSIEPEIMMNDRTDVEEIATEGLRGGLGPAPNPGVRTLIAGAVSKSAISSEPTGIPSDSVNCSPSDMDLRETPKASRNRMARLKGEISCCSHYNLRPEDCLCGICEDLRPFLDKMRSDYLRSGPSHLGRLRKEWLSHARWASTSNTRSSSRNCSPDFDIWSLDESSLEELANDGSVLDKPVVVTEAAQHSTAHSMDSVQAVIRDNHCESEVDRFLSLLSSNEQSTANSFLPGAFQVHDPKFMRFGRFMVLQRASMRAFNSLLASRSNDDHSCMNPLHSSLLTSGLSSVCVETTGAASGPHMSALGGSWFRSLVGKRLCAFARTSDLTPPMQGDRSTTSDQNWIPSPTGKVRLILLEPNQVLIMPPGTAFLHFAVNPSATLEGHFWDSKDVDRYIKATEMARQHPSFAGDIPPCVPQRALNGYQSIAREARFKGVCRQRSIDQNDEEFPKTWLSCLPPEESRVEDAVSGVSLELRSSNPSFAVRTESDTSQNTGERGVDRAKRVRIR